ncbi:universal stress protein [Actinomadura livida]|uniref:Nucleotide-binding universal stress UspA family protein n=1 Tax=Actinomadura livida TaxID=79909 RepID=A0A7W7MYK9_9ACTN|nr:MULTISPECIES: universal stress protein [Actinomadura]MBB4774950.1 nucleotide-binding universal stress UspA family protein [Actinomadura catellatispora]GGU04924.1 universal stress protein [Actinomadura livida]
MNGVDGNQRPHVLFGYDGTQENEGALRWAVEEARQRDLDLMICHCWHWPYASGHEDPDAEAIRTRAGENLLAQGVRRARELGAPGTVRRHLLRGPVEEALLEASRTAELTVIGSGERPGIGATALEVPARAGRPVIVVPDTAPWPRRVVAGTDAGEGCPAVLGFAFGEAALRGWDLHVVYGCWEPAVVSEDDLALFNDPELLEKRRTAELDEVVAPWRERHPEVDVTVSLMLERPCEALGRAADGAGLLVMGDRGTGFDPLGATSSAMLRRASLPVAIIPGRRSRT